MPKGNTIQYYLLGEETLLIQWQKEIDRRLLMSILQVTFSLRQADLPGVKDWNIAYNSLAIIFDPDIVTPDSLKEVIHKILKDPISLSPGKKWTIPVCYDPSVASDLESFCETKNLSVQELIKLHTKPVYDVHFSGFLPGFMYLGGLDKKLHQPRKSDPDRKIQAGSVAIGGEQTGIYPVSSPGGWHVIGNTPVLLFQPEDDPPCFISPGDQLVFSSISQKEYEDLKLAVTNKVFIPKPEPVDG